MAKDLEEKLGLSRKPSQRSIAKLFNDENFLRLLLNPSDPKLLAHFSDQRIRDTVGFELIYADAKDLAPTIAAILEDSISKSGSPVQSLIAARARENKDLLNEHLANAERTHPGLLTHDSLLGRLVGRRNGLLEATLPFVSPTNIDDPTHPVEIFRELGERTDSATVAGLALRGPGGIGKSRTALEVANIAYRSGWGVIHTWPTQQPLTNADLAKVVARSKTSLLIVLDYVSEFHQLDFSALEYELLSARLDPDHQLGILATIRRGVDLPVAARELLRIVDLEGDSPHIRRVCEQIVKRRAPVAVEQLGDEAFKLCGHRPMIAFLIAREIERLAELSDLSDQTVSKFSSGDLTHWLDRRLGEHGLRKNTAETPFAMAEVPDSLAVTASVLLAAPCSRETAIGVATRVAANVANPESLVPSVVFLEVLSELGWVDILSDRVAAVHDVVTDHVALEALADSNSVDVVLSGALDSAQAIERSTRHLARIIGEDDGDLLAPAVATWLERNALEIGTTISGAGAAAGSSALGALLDVQPFESAVFTNWGQIVQPWLLRHGEHRSAQYLLYRGLRQGIVTQTRAVTGLEQVAIRWLTTNGHLPIASMVIAPLIQLTAGKGFGSRDSIKFGMDWLQLHGKSRIAQYVLRQIQVSGTTQDCVAVTDYSLQWLQQHSSSPDASYVLDSLLSREDIEIRPELAEHAAKYVGSNMHLPGRTAWTLGWALGRPEIRMSPQLASVADEWTKQHGAGLHAAHVLRQRLRKAKSPPIDEALTWLEDHGSTDLAVYVLTGLLAIPGFKGRHTVERNALDWCHGRNTTHTSFVLGGLLSSPTKAHRAEIAEAAVNFLQNSPCALTDSHLIRPLIQLGAETNQAAVSKEAFRWLDRYRNTMQAGHILEILFDSGVPTGAEARLSEIAFAWLEDHGHSIDAQHVLRAALESKVAPVDRLTDFALSWLKLHHKSPLSQFVLTGLWKSGSMPIPEVVTTYTLDFLKTYVPDNASNMRLHVLLAEAVKQSTGWANQEFTALSFDWMDQLDLPPDSGHVLVRLIRVEDASTHLRTSEYVHRWCEKYPLHQFMPVIFRSLFKQGTGSSDWMRAYAVNWLLDNGQTKDAYLLFLCAFEDPELTATEFEQVAGSLAYWLESYRTVSYSHKLIRVLIRQSTEDQLDRLEPEVRAWLRSNQTSPQFVGVLKSLLQRAPTSTAWSETLELNASRTDIAPELVSALLETAPSAESLEELAPLVVQVIDSNGGERLQSSLLATLSRNDLDISTQPGAWSELFLRWHPAAGDVRNALSERVERRQGQSLSDGHDRRTDG